MNLPAFSDLTSAGLGAAVAGIIIKLLDRFYGVQDKKLDIASQLRDEMHKEISALKGEVATIKTDSDRWRSLYYEAITDAGKLKVNHEALGKEVAETREEVAILKLENKTLLKKLRMLDRVHRAFLVAGDCPNGAKCPLINELGNILTLDSNNDDE